MNKAISTNQLPPAKEKSARPRKAITTNEVQPQRNPRPETMRPRFTDVISTHNIEEVREKNAAESKTTKKGGPKGK